MNTRSLRVALVVSVLTLGGFIGSRGVAALTPEQKKELAAIRTELSHVHLPIKRDAIDEDEKTITGAEERLEKLVQEAQLKPNDSAAASIRRLIASRKEAIAKAREKSQNDSEKKPGTASKARAGTAKKMKKSSGQGISFVTQVAPVLDKHCVGCHGSDAKGGLRLDTFAGMRKGGKNGPLLVEGDASESLILARICAEGPGRMPKDADPLVGADIQAITNWINAGAKFDGDSESKSLSALVVSRPKDNLKSASKTKVKVARPTGDETISFTKDIAPFMVERCLRCHSGNDPKGGLSLETFDKLLAGGKSGPVIEPGNLDKSRIWDLVGKQKPFKMPPGDARITRTHWNSLQTWLREGAKFDGKDPQQLLTSLVPSESERRAAALAKMTPEQFREKRLKRSDDLWSRAIPKESPEHLENDSFVLRGNVSASRLEAIARWAAEGVQSAQAFLDEHSEPVFRGGLAIFVLKDRGSFEEFSQVVLKREPAAAIHGHAVVTPDLEDVYIAVQDLPDEATDDAPAARTNVVEHVVAAFVMRGDKKVPDWLVHGVARIVSSTGKSPASTMRSGQMYRLVGSLEKPEDVFNDGAFSQAAAGDVGAALVKYLIEAHGKPRLTRFAKSVQNGTSQSDAFRDIYQMDPHTLAAIFQTRVTEAAKRATN